MPRVCTVCTHPSVTEINKALASGQALRELSALYRVSEDAIARHRDAHLPATLVKAQESEDVRNAIDIYRQLKAINSAALSILSSARLAGNHSIALQAIDRLQRQIELQAKLIGELDERPTVNVLVSPQWILVRDAMLDALQEFPTAKAVVAARLVQLEGSKTWPQA